MRYAWIAAFVGAVGAVVATRGHFWGHSVGPAPASNRNASFAATVFESDLLKGWKVIDTSVEMKPRKSGGQSYEADWQAGARRGHFSNVHIRMAVGADGPTHGESKVPRTQRVIIDLENPKAVLSYKARLT